MRLSYLLLTLFLIASIVSSGQNQVAIHGLIKDEAGKPLISATVSLMKATDSSVLKFALSGNDGRYKFLSILPGRYIVSAFTIGYDTVYSPVFTLEKESKEMAAISLLQSKKELANVTVSATRRFIEMRLDKILINVDASPTNAGANMLEVLAKSPSITVDLEENISLNGKSGVLILIDGKQTYSSGKQLAALLKSMPALNVDLIEIMNNPPAKYEAQGTAGIINIVTKKSRTDGWNGNISLNGQLSNFAMSGKSGYYLNSQNRFNFNYKKGKINVFGSAGFSHYSGRDTASYDKTYYKQDYTVNGYSFFTYNGNKYKGNYAPLTIGLDYYINKKNTAGFVVTTSGGINQMPRDRITDVWDSGHQLLTHYNSAIKPEYGFNRTTVNVNWKHSFDTSGQDISFDADYVYENNPYRDTLTTDYSYPPGNTSITRLSNDSHQLTDIYAFKSDYKKPFKAGSFEAGVKFSYSKNTYTNMYYLLSNNSWGKVDNLNNYSTYDENINAVYVNVNKTVKKWSFQGGLRLENMNMRAGQTQGNYTISRHNTGLFPSFFAGYNLNDNNNFRLSISRRINRYGFTSIMPYVRVVDSLDLWRGNPALKPEHVTRMELGYGLKNKYFITFSYTISNDAIWYIAAQAGDKKITEFYPTNIDRLDNIAMEMTIPVKITKWWDVNFFSSVYSSKFYDVQNNNVSNFYFTLNENITNTFKLGKGFKGELDFNYVTKTVNQLGESFARCNNFSFGIQKQMLKEKGSLVLNIYDPFQWCNHVRSNGSYIRLYEKDNNYFTTRNVSLTFTYRFGKVNNEQRQHTTASQEEQGR